VDHVERLDPGRHGGELFCFEHLARYRWATAFAPGRRVLDVCGTGYGLASSPRRARLGWWTSPPGAGAARAVRPRAPVLVRADAVLLPFADGAFDLVVSFRPSAPPHPDRLPRRIRRVLRREGCW
jgi:hypothetical protein